MADVIDFKRKSRFVREPFDQITPRAQPWRVKGALPHTGIAFLVGATKAGKTFVAIDVTLRLASGAQRVLGGRRAHACGVAYVAAEDPEGCRARVAAWRAKAHRSSWTPFELIGQAFNLTDEGDAGDLRVTLTEIAADFASRGTPLGVVVIDTLARCIPGVDENSGADMSRALAAIEDLQRDLGVLVIVVAHFGKSGSERGIRGWSGLDAAADATLTVERDEADPELRTITFAKVKNGVDGGRLGFRLEPVGLGIVDEDGEEIASCVPAYEEAGEARVKTARRRALNPAETLVFAAVKYVTDNGQNTCPIPPEIEGAKPWQKAVRRADIRARAIVSGLAGDAKPDTALKRFNRALEGLSATRRVRTEGDLVWLL